MPAMHHRFAHLSLLALGALATALPAQWPTSPATNLPIGDAVGEQTLAKLAPTADGGWYLGWFDNRSGSYAVYLQRLDAAGNELWPHGGLLVSGNPQSTSLVDWDLIAAGGDCVVTFTDTRAGGDLDVYAYRIDPTGAFLWGANGVALSNNGDYEPNPRVVWASDGDCVFVWANTGTATLQMQRLDAAGVPRFPGDGIAIPGDAGAVPAFARIALGGSNGEVILSWVRALSFSGNKHVHAQKFDAAGNALWNGGVRLPVFDQASVPIAFEPRLVTDYAGGAWFAWHFAQGQQFFIRTQHVLATGLEAYPHNGVDVSASANSRFDPAIVADGLSGLCVVWNERNLAQSSWGIFAQKLDAAGTKQWGANGTTLLPIDTVVKFAPVAAPLGNGVAAAVLVESLGLLQKAVVVFGIDGAGNPRWSPATQASTFASDKLRLGLTTTTSGTSVLAWTDQRSAAADVYAQAVDLSGAVGLPDGLGQLVPYGCTNPAGSLVATADPLGNGRPTPGDFVQFDLTNPLGTQPAGSAGFLVYGTQAAPGYPCGVAVPGFGMAGPGQNGEVLVDLGAPYVATFVSLWGGGGTSVTGFVGIPYDGAVLGLSLFVQGLMVDLQPGAPLVFGLSTGVELRIGS